MLPPPLHLDWHPGDDPTPLRDREWLVTNGLGGFASGSLLGIGTRRYHGLFVPNLSAPKGRHILISRFDEEIDVDGRTVRIGGAEHLDGRLDSDLARHLRHFTWDGLLPTWRVEAGGHVIDRTVVMPHGQNTVCVVYRLVEGGPVRLRLRPFMAFRRQDAVLTHDDPWPFTLSFSRGRYELRRAESELFVRFGLAGQAGVFTCDDRTHADALYRVEQVRGYDHSEHLYSPGHLDCALQPGASLTFVATVHGWEALDVDGDAAIAQERARVAALVARAPAAAQHGFAAQLVAAADSFIVTPGSRSEESLQAGASGDVVRTVIAGYHWFGDWGRDTMISLEGLTLSTGRHEEARAILRTFSRYVRDGLLPNLFPEGEREALYHTADATFWFFHAIDRYVAASGDRALLAELYPVLRGIVDHHVAGTHYGIGMDPTDGLMRAGAPGYQLTWMDAKVDGWVVTPRRGKPVEIQALWFNALSLLAGWAAELGHPADDLHRLAGRVKASFDRRFWHEPLGHLLDVVDAEGGGDDPACRPNQVFTMSLTHPVLAVERQAQVLAVVREKLLTPYGLRTLAPDHPDYKPTYEGDLRTRDGAYHQGTVWPWLIGHFVAAWVRVHGDRAEARAMLEQLPGHLLDFGVGSISEIFDAEPPFAPRGCIAQAWSVAETLRAWLLTEPPAA